MRWRQLPAGCTFAWDNAREAAEREAHVSLKRTPESLTLSDLPGVDPARFDEWKRLHRRARRAPQFGLFIWASAFITVPVVGGGVGWLLPVVFWFTYMFVYAIPLGRAERKLGAELGVPAALGLPAAGGSTRARRVIKIVVIVWVISSVLGLIWFVVQLMSSKSEPAAGGESAAVVAEPTASAAGQFIVHLKDVDWEYLGARVPPQFFEEAGVKPHIGRFFLPSEDNASAAPVVVISHNAWQRFYGGKFDALGRAIQINGSATTIVGVAPAGFKLPGNTDFWMPAVASK
jgi:hypothetical protein